MATSPTLVFALPTGQAICPILEVLVVQYEASILPLALAALAARFASTIIPVTLLRRGYDFVRGTVIVLVWGGLRGGISIALPAGNALQGGPAC